MQLIEKNKQKKKRQKQIHGKSLFFNQIKESHFNLKIGRLFIPNILDLNLIWKKL
jgi:hypothetical protein